MTRIEKAIQRYQKAAKGHRLRALVRLQDERLKDLKRFRRSDKGQLSLGLI